MKTIPVRHGDRVVATIVIKEGSVLADLPGDRHVIDLLNRRIGVGLESSVGFQAGDKSSSKIEFIKPGHMLFITELRAYLKSKGLELGDVA